jgi:glycosyltransferase involved in cell wall biosynthesis
MPVTGPAFTLFFAGDAYSTAKKIMGRQSAGEAMIKGVARTWPTGRIAAFGPGDHPVGLERQLAGHGFGGKVTWSQGLTGPAASGLGAAYYPAPPVPELAHARNTVSPGAYSLIGVTHTLSSTGAMDQIGRMVLAPFQPWDALICTSRAALDVVNRLFATHEAWAKEHLGATRIQRPQTPVIPLGVDTERFAPDPAARRAARTALGLADGESVFLFAGRLSFHAKANPAPFYAAAQTAAAGGRRIVAIEAGVFPNDYARRAHDQARAALAPDVRFLTVDGADRAAYDSAWRAADVFVSLSDNVQETFGLTPLEAMAAGLPVLVSDWNGYRDTVRDGVDGYRIPTFAPPPGGGDRLAASHSDESLGYDHFVGLLSLVTVVAPEPLAEAVQRLADSPDLRARMGIAGRARACESFAWPVVLHRYDALARELASLRPATPPAAVPWPGRPEPLNLFAGHPTATVRGHWIVARTPGLSTTAVDDLIGLTVANYGFMPAHLTEGDVRTVFDALAHGPARLDAVASANPDRRRGVFALMWLGKFDLVRLTPPA